MSDKNDKNKSGQRYATPFYRAIGDPFKAEDGPRIPLDLTWDENDRAIVIESIIQWLDNGIEMKNGIANTYGFPFGYTADEWEDGLLKFRSNIQNMKEIKQENFLKNPYYERIITFMENVTQSPELKMSLLEFLNTGKMYTISQMADFMEITKDGFEKFKKSTEWKRVIATRGVKLPASFEQYIKILSHQIQQYRRRYKQLNELQGFPLRVKDIFNILEADSGELFQKAPIMVKIGKILNALAGGAFSGTRVAGAGVSLALSEFEASSYTALETDFLNQQKIHMSQEIADYVEPLHILLRQYKDNLDSFPIKDKTRNKNAWRKVRNDNPAYATKLRLNSAGTMWDAAHGILDQIMHSQQQNLKIRYVDLFNERDEMSNHVDRMKETADLIKVPVPLPYLKDSVSSYHSGGFVGGGSGSGSEVMAVLQEGEFVVPLDTINNFLSLVNTAKESNAALSQVKSSISAAKEQSKQISDTKNSPSVKEAFEYSKKITKNMDIASAGAKMAAGVLTGLPGLDALNELTTNISNPDSAANAKSLSDQLRTISGDARQIGYAFMDIDENIGRAVQSTGDLGYGISNVVDALSAENFNLGSLGQGMQGIASGIGGIFGFEAGSDEAEVMNGISSAGSALASLATGDIGGAMCHI